MYIRHNKKKIHRARRHKLKTWRGMVWWYGTDREGAQERPYLVQKKYCHVLLNMKVKRVACYCIVQNV